jgi:hypothetical protein
MEPANVKTSGVPGRAPPETVTFPAPRTAWTACSAYPGAPYSEAYAAFLAARRPA